MTSNLDILEIIKANFIIFNVPKMWNLNHSKTFFVLIVPLLTDERVYHKNRTLLSFRFHFGYLLDKDTLHSSMIKYCTVHIYIRIFGLLLCAFVFGVVIEYIEYNR